MATSRMSCFLRQLTRGMVAQTLADLADPELIQRLLAGPDEAAFEVLVRRHGPMVYRVCWRVLQQAEDCEDAFQATFLLLAQKLPTVKKRDSLASWLHGVAYRVALDAKRQAGRRRCHEVRLPVSPDGPPDEIAWREVRAVLDAELARLPEKLRLPLILCHLEGQSQEEAARQLGWSKRTLQRRLEEGRSALGNRLTRKGFVWSAALSGVLLSNCTTSAALSSRFIGSTVEAAASTVAGRATAGVVSANVTALVEGVVKAMFMSKMKSIAVVLILGIALLSVPLGLAGGRLITWSGFAAAQPPQDSPPPKAARPQDERPPEPRAPIVVEGEGVRVNYLAWSPNGRMIATVIPRPGRVGEAFPQGYTGPSWTWGLKMWDARTGKLLWKLQLPPEGGGISPVTFSADSKTVAGVLTYKVNKLKLWDTATGKEKTTVDVARTAGYRNIVFSPDGKTLAVVGDYPIPSMHDGGLVGLWDAKTGKVLWEQTKAHAERVYGLAFSPDGKTLATGSRDLTVKLWDAATGKLLRTLVGHGEPGVLCVAFSPDGKTLASGGMDGTCRIWDVYTGELQHTIGGYGGTGAAAWVAFSPRGGKTLLTAGYPTDQITAEQKPILIRLVDLQTVKLPRVVSHAIWPSITAKRTVPVQGLWNLFEKGIAFSPDGKTLAIGGSGDEEGKKMKLILQPLED